MTVTVFLIILYPPSDNRYIFLKFIALLKDKERRYWKKVQKLLSVTLCLFWTGEFTWWSFFFLSYIPSCFENMFCLKWIKIYLIFIYIPTLSIPCLTLVQPRPIHIRWYLCAKITKFDLCKAANILIVFCGLGDLFCFLRVFYCKCFRKITYFEWFSHYSCKNEIGLSLPDCMKRNKTIKIEIKIKIEIRCLIVNFTKLLNFVLS